MHSKEQMKSALEAAHRYAQAITPEALAYLEGRGISEQVAARFLTGCCIRSSSRPRASRWLVVNTLPHRIRSMRWL
jgi:DNA primase